MYAKMMSPADVAGLRFLLVVYMVFAAVLCYMYHPTPTFIHDASLFPSRVWSTRHSFQTRVVYSDAMRRAHQQTQLSSSPSYTQHQIPDPRIVIVTTSSNADQSRGIPHQRENVYENRMSYALRHGYGFMWANSSTYTESPDAPQAPQTAKLLAVRDAFARYPSAEWVWYLPLDSIIMTSSLQFEALLSGARLTQAQRNVPSSEHVLSSSDVEMLVMADSSGIDASSFAIRRGSWADWVLERWGDEDRNTLNAQAWREDDPIFSSMYSDEESIRQHTALMSRNAMGSRPTYMDSMDGGAWKVGDLCVKFDGCAHSSKCADNWKVMWDSREKYLVSDLVRENVRLGRGIEDVEMGI